MFGQPDVIFSTNKQQLNGDGNVIFLQYNGNVFCGSAAPPFKFNFVQEGKLGTYNLWSGGPGGPEGGVKPACMKH